MQDQLNIFDQIFRNEDDSLSFLIDNGILPRVRNCDRCMCVNNSMNIVKYRTNNQEVFVYRCTRCRSRKGLLSFTHFKTGKMKLNIY